MRAPVPTASEYWPDTESNVCFVAATQAPRTLPITAVKIYAVRDDSLLLTKVGRGWDLPGGHIEVGETPELALRREIMEETGATVGDIKLIGYLHITNTKENERNKRYPKQSCILVFKASSVAFDTQHNLSEFEATETALIPFADVPAHHHQWSQLKQQILSYSLLQ
jgi:8-oxo-dGTP pyrophosphatase MutT (NUDIX family)